MEHVVPHQSSWHESTGLYDVRQNQAGGSFVQKEVSGHIDIIAGNFL